jgi:hypothetical protein
MISGEPGVKWMRPSAATRWLAAPQGTPNSTPCPPNDDQKQPYKRDELNRLRVLAL